MDTPDPSSLPDGLQPVTDADFATPPTSLVNVQGSVLSAPPAPVDNPDPTTNGEIPAPEPAPSDDQLQPVTDADFAEPSIGDKIKSGLKAVNDAAGSAADDLVRPFVGQANIDQAPADLKAGEAWGADKIDKIQKSPLDPTWAAADLALGGNPDQPSGLDVMRDIGVRSYNALGAGAGQFDRILPDVGTVVAKAAGAAPYAYDKIASLVSDTPTTSAYDWWNRNAIQPQKDFSARLNQESQAEADQSGAVGTGMQIAGSAGGQLAEMSLMGPEEAAAKLTATLPREGFAGGFDILKDGLTTSARLSSIPAVVNASKAQDAVYQQTGDPLAAVKAGVMSGVSTWLGNTVPLSIAGPLAMRVFTGGVAGAAGSEVVRQMNNAAMPDNMQEPFTWKGLWQNTASSAAMAGFLAGKEQEDYQTAYIRYNGIQKAATDGNAGAKRTADVIDTLSQVTNNIDNAMVDSAVHGVTVSNAKMAKTHDQLQVEDPRYAAIFKATQNGPAPVDPKTGEAIARDAYANEVSTNAAFDKYTELTGKENQSIALAKNAAISMETAHKIVPRPELDILSRWAAYDQPSQLQFNRALNETIQNKVAPDYIHDKYDADFDKDGIPNEQAYARDHAARPDSFDAFYAPNPKMEQSLQAGGIHYYRMADGRLGIRGHTSQYTSNVFSHVYDKTGIVPLKPGEPYVNQESTPHPEQEVRPEKPVAGSDQGDEAEAGSEAEAGKPEQPHGQQDGDEGHGSSLGTGSVLGHEGAGNVDAEGQNLTARAQPVADALAKAGVSAPISPTGRVTIDPNAPDAAKTIDATAVDAAEHPQSERRPVTPGEKSYGHYPVAKVLLTSDQGDVPVDIENPAGSIRKSQPDASDKFSRKMIDAHYGRIPGTIGADGEPLDVFLTKNAHDDTRPVAVLTQHNPQTGAFDEMKVVMGAKSKGEAMSVYGKQYPMGMVHQLLPNGKNDIVMMSRAKFADYIHSGATDVPPHPISGAPMLKLRENVPFEGDAGSANMDDMDDKVKAVNTKHDTNLTYNQNDDTITGDIPAAKATAIHKSFSRIDGYAGSKINGHPIEKHADVAGSSPRGEVQEGSGSAVQQGKERTSLQDRAGTSDSALAGSESGQAQSVSGQRAHGIPVHALEKGTGPLRAPAANGIPDVKSDAPLFQEGEGGPHPVRVTGVHYSSKEGLTELDPREAGTGSAGGERKRFGAGNFGRGPDAMGRRTAFYVREGNELPPKESAVAGTHAYETQLNNLYDMRTDPDHIVSDAANHDDFEERVHDAGYDGYLANAMPGMTAKHVAVVMGVHGTIPVKDVGTSYLAKVSPDRERRIGLSDQEIAEENKNKVKEKLADKLNESTKDKLKDLSSEGEEDKRANPRLMFAGEKAKTGDKGALAYAKKIESEEQPKSAKEMEALTHGMTGWSRGADSKWRFEINDKDSRLKPGAMDLRGLHSEKGVPLGDVLDHPALYEAYPKIANDVHVKVEPRMPAEAGAMFDPETNTMMFHDLSMYPKTGDHSVQSILLHEAQHYIQREEDHATGGSPMEFLGPLKEQKQRLTTMRQGFRDQLDDLNDGTFADGRDGVLTKDEEKQHEEISAHIERINDMIRKQGLTDYQSMMGRAASKYMKIAGENEAYNVQERQNMTDAERLAMPPSMTEKYPRAEQIVRFGENDIEAHIRQEKPPTPPELNEEEKAQAAKDHHDAVQQHVMAISKAWKGAPPIHVVSDRTELPKPVQAYLDHFLGKDEDPAGLFHDGHVYLMSHSLTDPEDAGRVLLHEAIGHYGLHSSKTLGRDLPKLLDEIHASVKDTKDFKRIAALYEKIYGAQPNAQARRDLAEEYLAKVAETGKNPTIMQKVVAFVHDAMRRMGMAPKWNEGDIATMMARVHRDVVEGRVNDRGLESPQTTFSGKDFTATSTYRGAAGEGTVILRRDGSRELDIGDLHATLQSSVLDGRVVNSVEKLADPSPESIRSLARFTQEEGRAGVAIGKENVTKAQIEASGVPFKERPGYYELNSSENLPANTRFSVRNAAKGDPEDERILAKTIDHSVLDMTPWDRLQQVTRDFRDNIQNGDTALEMKQSTIDAGASIENYERHANGGLLLDAAQSAYKSYWMARNNEQITAGVLKNGVPEYKDGSFVSVAGRKGFIDMLAPLYKGTPDGKPLDRLFEGYAVAHRANELIKQTNADGTSKEKLLTQPEIDKLMALDQKYPQFKKVLSDLQNFNKQLLDLAVDRGSMSKAVADQWKQNMYVPFYRSMQENESSSWRGASNTLSGKKVTSKKLVGSQKKIEPVIESIVKNTSSILDKIYSNEAMRRVVALTDGIGMERAKIPMRAMQMSAEEAIGQLAKAGIEVDKSNLTDDDLNTLTTMFRPQKPVGADIVSVVENGKNIYYHVTDPLLLRSITNLQSIGDIGKVMDTLLGGAKRIYTVATTLDPRFMARIFLKDMMQSWMQTGTNPNMFKHLVGNAKDVLTDSHFLNDLRIAGYNGNEYYRIEEVRDLMSKLEGDKWNLLNSPKKLWEAYKHVGWMSEQTSRLTIAKHTLDRGGSMAEAAWQGQNTLNWQKRGDGKLAQYVMRGAPFMNAHIQGLTRLYDGMMGRDVTMNRQRAVTSFFLKGISLMLPTLALNLYNQQNKDYERLPDEAKDLYWHFYAGGTHYTLAKPFEAGAIAATIPERVMRVLQGKDTARTFAESMGNVANQMFGMNPIPRVALPVIEDIANKQQLGSKIPIVSEHEQELQPGAQVGMNTSPTVTAIARHMPEGAPDSLRSPVRLQHLIQGYTSSIGMYALQFADAMQRATGHAPPRAASPFSNPVTAGLAHIVNADKPASDTRNRYVDEVYSAQHDADAAAKTISTYVKQGHINDAREVMQNNRTALQYRNELHTVSSKMGELRTMEQAINASTTLSPQDKRTRLDNINQMRERMLDRVAPMLDMVTDFH
jgi:hypothetical protein